MVVEIKDHEHYTKFLAEHEFVVVDFYATWCGPCIAIGPKIELLAKEYLSVKFCKVDVDQNSSITESCKITAMPTFHFYKNNTKKAEVVGASEEKIKLELEKLLKL